MSFTDHKITAFAHKIADLPDQPTLPPDELKSRFDACPEELRQSLNAVCDDAARLEARVEGIVVDTFGDTIDKEMLSDELAAELDGKAEAADLTALDARVETAENTLPEKVECHFGMYTGNGQRKMTVSPRLQSQSGDCRIQQMGIQRYGLSGNSYGILFADRIGNYQYRLQRLLYQQLFLFEFE